MTEREDQSIEEMCANCIAYLKEEGIYDPNDSWYCSECTRTHNCKDFSQAYNDCGGMACMHCGNTWYEEVSE